MFVNVFNAVVDERAKFVDRWREMLTGDDALGRIIGRGLLKYLRRRLIDLMMGCF